MRKGDLRYSSLYHVYQGLRRSISGTEISRGRNTHVQPRKPLVAESRDSIAKQRQSQEDEEHLPGFTRKDPDTGLLFKHIDARDEEQRAAKVDGQSDGDVADDK